jgi:DNA-binding IclR family transcriptional regulator
MELGNPQHLARLKSTAPALNRGLAIMTMLNQNSPLSLENLNSQLNLPKASLFRLLQTLQTSGMIRKNPDKAYEPLWSLSPLHDASTLLRQHLEKNMPALAHKTSCTAEWYEPHPEGLKLLLQFHPDNEARVQAKPGFIRPWQVEFEAVARLGHAFCPTSTNPTSTSLYTSNGKLTRIGSKEISRLLKLATTQKTATDLAFNTNGVRRTAAVALHQKKFIGVLALAETYHFKKTNPLKTQLPELQKILAHL